MTAAELIVALEKLPKDHVVMIFDTRWGCYDMVNKVGTVILENHETPTSMKHLVGYSVIELAP